MTTNDLVKMDSCGEYRLRMSFAFPIREGVSLNENGEMGGHKKIL